MEKNTDIKLFQDRQVRSVWDETQEQWLFSIVDVVAILTDSADPKQYIKKMRSRDQELNVRWGTICTPTKMQASEGKIYTTQAATSEGVFRLIQSIPSPKAEPFKQWMAKVAAQRLDQMADPELSINQALEDYRRLGYSDNWINQRLKSIEIRKDLTDQWKQHNMEPGVQYATLTDIIYQAWAGRTAKEYKQLKGLRKENLRDNMTNEELVLIPEYISHIRRNKNGELEFQSNEEHSLGVAELARQFAKEFEMGEWGYVMGMLHDKGKETQLFQAHIKRSSGIDSTADERGYQGHAFVGGLIAKLQYPKIFSLIGNPLMGHHRGLYDYSDLEDETQKEIPQGVSVPSLHTLPFPQWFNPSILQTKDFHHVERMLFSCLVDADYLDTERFMQPKQYEQRASHNSMSELLQNLETHLASFGEPKTEVNRIRNEVQQCCREKADGIPGFYSLTVPTGGGKTLASLVWALHHAVVQGKRRIIIAIPYTSIIVQTAAILRNIFGSDNVLEHHSNVTIDDRIEDSKNEQLRLATENWDYPIIVTTNVQLFESMMSSHSSDCRKLHNIVNSVLILDEVQTLPTDFLQPIVDSLDTYQRLFGVSVLFTTASQPVLEGDHQGTNPNVMLKGLKSIKEIIPKGSNLHEHLRRVRLDIDNTSQTYDELVEKLTHHDRVLCIVNTRRDAKEIFDRLPDEGICIHLSRMMCPAHLSAKIQEMKEALKKSENTIIRVVSTQLIEAGVDIDFPVVYRQEAGLDSILQAAGRCNREGKLELCTTHVFSLSAEHPLPRGFISQCNNARLNMVGEYDWFSPLAMNDYFIQLYSRIQNFDKKDMKYHLYNVRELMMESAAREFRLIDEDTISVIVNWEGSLTLVEQLKKEGPSYRLIKQLSQYSVNLRKHDFDEMKGNGLIDEIISGFYVTIGKNQYNDNVGLLTENHWLEETYIV